MLYDTKIVKFVRVNGRTAGEACQQVYEAEIKVPNEEWFKSTLGKSADSVFLAKSKDAKYLVHELKRNHAIIGIHLPLMLKATKKDENDVFTHDEIVFVVLGFEEPEPKKTSNVKRFVFRKSRTTTSRRYADIVASEHAKLNLSEDDILAAVAENPGLAETILALLDTPEPPKPKKGQSIDKLLKGRKEKFKSMAEFEAFLNDNAHGEKLSFNEFKKYINNIDKYVEGDES